MIDIHCHALFGVDDGAKSLNDSVSMLKKATESGIDKVVLTPHYMEDGYKNEPEILTNKFNSLKQKLEEENVNIQICYGEEVFASMHVDELLKKNKIFSLNNSKYVLIEFPIFEEFICIEEIIFRLTSMGKVPIIAHPERYAFTARHFEKMYSLVEQGALLQINANSLVGRYGKHQEKMAIKLLKSNLVHFVATDAHSNHNYDLLTKSLKRIERIVGKSKFEEITTINQEKLLNNETIDPIIMSKVLKVSGFFKINKQRRMSLIK